MNGSGLISQIGNWVLYPFTNKIPVVDLVMATLIIVIVVWFLSDGSQWPKIEAVVS